MAENEKHSGPETQHQRWLKYGANVVIATIVVIALAVAVTYAAQRAPVRLDTTKGGSYSLKPQTVNIINDLKQKVKIVSLYTKQNKKDASGKDQDPEEFARPVRDLLEEYQRKGKNIEIDEIDPVENPTKADALVADITSRYGGEITKYKEVIAEAVKAFDEMKPKLAEQSAAIRKLPKDSFGSQQGFGDISKVLADEFDDLLTRIERADKIIKTRVGEKLPNYKGATSTAEELSDDISQRVDALIQFNDRPSKGLVVTDAGKKYLADARPVFDAIKKSADALHKKLTELGSLKLDEVREKLSQRNAILVVGEKDMRSLSFDQVWKNDVQDARRVASGEELKPRFAGEQQITAAILALTSDRKPKVAFVRPGGPPVTSPGFPPFQPSGPFSIVAERLRDYNFDVIEKDLSGQFAMQAQMQGQPAPPEPTDEELKDAVWVVLSLPNQQQNPMSGPPPPIGPKVAAHLAQGGSALLLFDPSSDNCAAALKEWGIDVMTDVMAVHEPVPGAPATNDFIELAKREPVIFVGSNYGDHLITKPIASLDSVLFPRLIVKKIPTSQPVKTIEFLPVPDDLPIWGERDIQGAGQGQAIKKDENDLSPPLFSGAIAEREGGGRVIAIGSVNFIANAILTMPDPVLREKGIRAYRFPGNSELFTNSVFWLARMEPLIAISPAAMDVSRIGTMSDATLRFWRVGAVLIILPGLVIVAGAAMYVLRRD